MPSLRDSWKHGHDYFYRYVVPKGTLQEINPGGMHFYENCVFNLYFKFK